MAQSKSAAIRRRSLAKALRPGAAPLRELILTGDLPEPVGRAFRELHLNPTNETDWKVLAALLAIHLFDRGKTPGRPPTWAGFQLIELLWQAHKLRQKNPSLINSDERTCEWLTKKGPAHFRSGKGKGTGLVKQLREARQKFKDISAAFPLAFGRN
jgi:hypothetical protein